MWNAIVEGLSPHLVAGSIMVVGMGVMYVAHRMWGSRYKRENPLEVLKLRFASGEISRQEYEERRKVIAD
jgi:putative membrane protein